MRLFRISGTCGNHKMLDAEFIGNFVLREGSDVIEGYMEETYGISFIKGLYIEDKNQLAFVKMSNTSLMYPLAYTFPDLKKNGVWSGCTLRRGFFHHDTTNGEAVAIVEEIQEGNFQRSSLMLYTVETFERYAAHATAHNRDLMAEVERLKEFLDNPPTT